MAKSYENVRKDNFKKSTNSSVSGSTQKKTEKRRSYEDIRSEFLGDTSSRKKTVADQTTSDAISGIYSRYNEEANRFSTHADNASYAYGDEFKNRVVANRQNSTRIGRLAQDINKYGDYMDDSDRQSMLLALEKMKNGYNDILRASDRSGFKSEEQFNKTVTGYYGDGDAEYASERAKIYEDSASELAEINQKLESATKEEKKALKKRKKELEKDNKLYERGNMATDAVGFYKNNPDYEENAVNKGYDFLTYEDYLDQERAYESGDINAYHAAKSKHWDFITEDERKTYYYLLNTQGKDQADQFIDSLSVDLGKRAEDAWHEKIDDSNLLQLIAQNVASVPTNVYGGAPAFIADAVDFALGRYNPYASENDMVNFAQDVRSTTAQKLDNMTGGAKIPWINFGLGELYNSVMSSLDSLLGVSTLGKAYTVFMGGNAAVMQAKKLYEKGASNKQIAIGALSAGVAETIFEEISADAFLNLDSPKTKLDIVKNALLQGGVEAEEEIATEIVNTITDGIIMGDYSEFMESYNEKGLGGALSDTAGNVASAGLGGFISGGSMAGVSGGIQYGMYDTDMRRIGRAYGTEGASTLADIAKEKSIADSKLIDDVRAISEKEAPTAKEYGKVGRLNDAIQNANVDDSIEKSIKEAADELGIPYDDAFIGKVQDYITSNAEKKIAPKSVRDVAELLQDDSSFKEKVNKGIIHNQSDTVQSFVEKTVKKSMDAKYADKVSESGNAVDTRSGKEIEITGIKSIDGSKMILRTADGGINSDVVEYASTEEAATYEQIKALDCSAEVGNYILQAMKVSDLSASEFMADASLAYTYGKYNLSDSLNRLSIPKTVAKQLFSDGRTAAYRSADKMQKTNMGKKIAKKVGGVYFESNVDTKNLNDLQKSFVRTAKALSKVSAANIHVYSSYENADGKRYAIIDGIEVANNANGYYSSGSGDIYVDINAGDNYNGVALYTLGHEFSHQMRDNNAKGWQNLADAVVEAFADDAKFNALVDEKADDYRRRRDAGDDHFSSMSDSQIDDLAYEETICDSLSTMLTEEETFKEIANKIKEKDQSLWEKLKQFFADFLAKIDEIVNPYKDVAPDDEAGRAIKEASEEMKQKLSKLYAEVFVDAQENYNGRMEEAGVQFDTASESVAPFNSERTWTESEYVKEREETAKKIASELKVSLKKAYRYIDDINGVAALIAGDRTRLDYDPNIDPNASVLKPNSDYGESVDMSTLCAKRLLFTGTFDAIQKMFPNTVFTSEDIVKIRKMMDDRGYQVACGICYVESTRREIGRITEEFIDRYKESQKTGKEITRFNNEGKESVLKAKGGKTFIADVNYTPTLAELNTTDIDKVKVEHPDVYEAYLAFMNARGQSKPKLLETRAEYKGEILNKFKRKKDGSLSDTTKKKNNSGGLRLQSFSDFELVHLIDMMQITMDMARCGLKSQAYTKVPEFALAFGDTGIKINLSLIAKGSGLDADGNLIFDDIEGMPSEVAFELRKRFSKNVGTILVGKNDEHIIKAMADDRIDYIIPFHKSSWSQGLYDALGLTGYEDYTSTQHEKPIGGGSIKDFDPIEYWDFTKSGDENAQIYLDKCKKEKRIPKFPQFQGYPGYWKLLIDFKMYDNDGVGSRQEAVQPIFDPSVTQRLLEEYKGGHRSFPVAQDVVDDFAKEYKENHSDVKYSERVTDKDTLRMLNKQLEEGNVTKVYRAMQVQPVDDNGNVIKASVNRVVSYEPLMVEAKTFGKNGKVDVYHAKLFSPMAGMVNGRWSNNIELNAWEQTTEDFANAIPVIDKKTGKQKIDNDKKNASYGEPVYNYGLVKGGIDDNGKALTDVPARYNPYIHTSLSALNDQFSSANKRPELVTVECIIPNSELTSGYRAKGAKDRVGAMKWHSGPTSSRLAKVGKARTVILTQYDMPLRVVPDSEVAKTISEYIGDTPNIAIPESTVTPSLAKELKSLGVSVLDSEAWEEYSAKFPTKTFGKHKIAPIKKVDRVGKSTANLLDKSISSVQSNVKNSDRSPVPTFYSQMSKVIDGIKTEKVGANGVIPYLKGKGIKDEEIKWSGIEAFLEGKKSVTKSELQEFAKGSMLHIEEKKLDGTAENSFNIFIENINEYYPFDIGDADRYFNFNNDFILEFFEEDVNTLLEEGEITEAEHENILMEARAYANGTYGNTKWSDYVTEGSENYREILFKIPGSDYSNNSMNAHWGESGVIAHARVDDMVLSDGSRMLFVEEIQSDWHNAGQSKGYKPSQKLLEKLQKAYDDAQIEEKRAIKRFDEWKHTVSSSDLGKAYMGDDTIGLSKKKQELQEYKDKVNDAYKKYHDVAAKHDNGVPDSPFKSTYTDFVMKRLIRMAAEGNYDYVGWTTAKMQEDRWSSEYAEGYRIEYDQDIPKFVAKYGKKWGVKVSKERLAQSGDSVWAFEIPQSMRDSVLYEGQPLFSERSNFDAREALANALEPLAQNGREKELISQYKDLIFKINASNSQIKEMYKQIDELKKTQGNEKKIKDLSQEAKKLSISVNAYDSMLLKIEAAKPFRDIVRKERISAANEAREEAKQRYQRRIDGLKSTEVRRKIKNLVDRFNSKEFKPRPNNYIPASLVKPVNEVLSMINLDSGLSEGLTERLAKLKVAYDALKNDPKYNITYDPIIADMIQNLNDEIGDTSIYEMSLSQLETTYRTLYALMHTVVNAAKIQSMSITGIDGGELTAIDVANEMQKETSQARDTSSNVAVRWLQTQLRPETMFERLGGFKKNSMWGKVYKMLDQGQLDMNRYIMESRAIFDEIIKDKDYLEEVSNPKKLIDCGLIDDNGNPVPVTRGMMLMIKMSLLNEENKRHILVGGLTVPDIAKYYKGSDDAYGIGRNVIHGIGGEGLASINRQISEAIEELKDAKEVGSKEEADKVQKKIDVLKGEQNALYEEGKNRLKALEAAIDSKLTDQDKLYISLAQKYFDGYSKDLLNKVTMTMYGFEKARVKNYLPIHTDPGFRKANFEQITKDMSLENSGFMKDRVQASNPILLEDLSDIINSQIKKTARYAGLTLAVKDFNKIYGHTEPGFTSSLQDTISRKFGKPGLKYIDNLMTDIVGGRDTDPSIFDKTRGYMAGSVLSLNPRVALAQAASYPTAASELGWKPLAKALGMGLKPADRELIAKYSPLLYTRMEGGADIDISNIKNVSKTKDKIMRELNFLMGWINAMDAATVGRLWYASQYYVDDHTDLKKGTDDYYMEVARVFNDVVEKTQPNYTTLQRPDILRNSNAVVKQLTMFMTQRLQNFNIVYESAEKYNRYRTDYIKGINGVTKDDVNEVRTNLVNAVTSQVLAGATIVGIKFLVDALMKNTSGYGDDDDEVAWTLVGNFLENLIGNFLGGSELYSVLKSIVMKTPYYGISENGIGVISDILEDIVKLAQKPDVRKTRKLGEAVSKLFGIPTENAIKIVKAVIGYFDVEMPKWLQ